MLIPRIVLSLGGGFPSDFFLFPSDFMFFPIVFNIFQNVSSKHTLLLLSEHMKQEREEERERERDLHILCGNVY